MSRPNITIPSSFGGIKTDFDNNHLTNGFPQLTPDVLPGDCLNKFIDDTYKGLNGVLELFKGAVLYDVTETYTDKSIVFYINSNNEIKVYRSLQNSNTGNALTNDTYWQEVELGYGKANVDLTNLSSAGKNVLDGQWVQAYNTLADSVTYTADQWVTYDLSTILPNDNYIYECLFTGWWRTGSASGNITGAHLYSGTKNATTQDFSAYLGRVITRTANAAIFSGNCILPIYPTDRAVTYRNEDGVGTSGSCTLRIQGYRRVGTNS